MACKCYHAERNFVGKIGVCWGTKEREACSCGGDESKCDFYEDKRKKATPKQTHYDEIRAMSIEELAEWIAHPKFSYCQHDICDGETDCAECALVWMKLEAEEGET